MFILERPTVRTWFFADTKLAPPLPPRLSTLGSGPIDEFELDEFLRRHGFEPVKISPETSVLILGRGGWMEDQIMRLLDARVGQTLKVYSQEMFSAFMAGGEDPFDAGETVLRSMGEGHPGLEFLQDLGFEWPETQIVGESQSDLEFDRPKRGPLKELGYSVGLGGAAEGKRRDILSRAFEGELPFVKSERYMRRWGDPGSATRLYRIAGSIASFCKNAKRRSDARMSQAIGDWESDLEWLKDTFYTGRFRFQWPDASVGDE